MSTETSAAPAAEEQAAIVTGTAEPGGKSEEFLTLFDEATVAADKIIEGALDGSRFSKYMMAMAFVESAVNVAADHGDGADLIEALRDLADQIEADLAAKD